ncbi:SusC/RagA family TonB-linked outer membrane protein [Chitinophaga defluvii]|uniref:TonB-dependent receptor n=1 Tax=Chitinophaga defluvii TaxID=3163343 RepID=A0ABV2TED1_9BACT
MIRKKCLSGLYPGMGYAATNEKCPRRSGILMRALLFCWLTLFFASAHAQTVTLSGKVADQQGTPLPGVNVMVKGSSKGVQTNEKGIYTIAVDPGTRLVFSFLGYASQEIGTTGGQKLDVTLEEEGTSLNQVVVVGYGAQRKATLTGAVASIGNRQINTSTNSNLQQNLAGKLAGVKITTNSSEPGAFQSHINIRGLGAPLIVIDGVTSDMNTFNRLSAADIASVSVLKDASAAVYGVQAGNGVVLVTTRNGNADGKTRIQYQGSYGLTRLGKYPEAMNAYDWAQMINEVARSEYVPQPEPFSKEQLEKFRNTPGLNLMDAYMRDFAPQQNHQLNVSGNTGKNNDVTYFLSGALFNDQGNYRSGDLNYKRYNFRSNISAKLAHGLSVDVKAAYMADERNTPDQGAWNMMKQMWTTRPVNPMTGEVLTSLYANNNPLYPADLGGEFNPVVNTDKDNGGGYHKWNQYQVQAQAALNWEVPFVQGLKARAMYNYQRTNMEHKGLSPIYLLYTFNKATGEYKGRIPFGSVNRITQNHDYTSQTGYQASLDYERTFQRHHVKGLFLFEQIVSQAEGFAAARQLVLPSLDNLAAGEADKTQVIGAGYPTAYASQGLVGRLNYDFSDKYIVEFSFRYGGSSKYAAGNRWGLFPSAALGWRISEEKFFKNTSALSFVDNLKFRGSYGVLGDDRGAAYQWASGYVYPAGAYYFGATKVNGLTDRGAVNPLFTWYKDKMTNIGVDATFWKGLLGGSFDYFRRVRTGLPAKRVLTIPGVTGVGLPDENLNSDQTAGFDFEVNHTHHLGALRYSLSGNFVYSVSKTLHAERAPSRSSYDNWRSNPTNRMQGTWWTMQNEGFITPGTDIFSLPNEEGAYQNSMFTPGDYHHKDLNGDGYVDGNDIMPSSDMVVTSAPLIQYGFTVDLSWKGIDVNLHFMGAGKKYVNFMEFLKTPYVFGGAAGSLAFHNDRWRQDENGNWIEGAMHRYRSGFTPNERDDDRSIQNASYLRLKSAEIGYNLPAGLIKRVGLENARIYVNGFNLLTFTRLKHIDPENPGITNLNWGNGQGDDTTWGYIYPVTRNYNLGLSITF